MAHFVGIIKARNLQRKLKQYLIEKEIGYYEDESDYELLEESEFEEERSTWCFTNRRKSPNSVENLVWKSVMGFIGGVILTYVFFFFFHIVVNSSLHTATSLWGLAGVILCLGFAFSSIVRCYVLLFLPVFFSKEGRQVLLTYALFLAFTGPGCNTMQNMGILTNSMICGQNMVKKTLKQIFETVKVPYKATKEAMEKIIKTLKEVVQSFKHFMMKMVKLLICIFHVIDNANAWLRSVTGLCNRKFGTPFQRCMNSFSESIADCKVKLGPISCLCHVVHIAKGICYSVKYIDPVCVYTEFDSEKTLVLMKKKLEKFKQRINNLFYVSTEFWDRYDLERTETNVTRKMGKTTCEKVGKIIEKLQSVFSIFGYTFSLLFLFLSFKVYSYKYKYLCSDQYDNVYIGKYILELDIKRAQMDRETVLPLEPRERKKYGKPTAIRLLEIEKTRITQSMYFVSLTSFKVLTFLMIDYSLFWVLCTIYKTGYDAMVEVEKSKFSIHVSGEGAPANFYRSLGKAFEIPENPNMHLTPIHCLPDPIQPDTRRYVQIGFLVVACWILTVTEAYGLRFRNVVMSHYYPDRARERAIWLYNHILRSRMSFLRYARRQLRKKYCGQIHQTERLSLMQRLFANFPIVGVFCGGRAKENNCLICGPPQTTPACLKRCRTPDCEGRYCLECFATLQNVCTICQHPLEYGDVSDLSEEIDSSEDDAGNGKQRENYENGEFANEKFLTFKDMEVRDKFKDVESNKVPDYAKLDDLGCDNKALKNQLKAVLQRHIQNAKKGKTHGTAYPSLYRQIRIKLENLISDLKRKKSREITLRKLEIKRKFVEKIESLKNFKRKKREGEEKEAPPEEASKRLKSKVSFKLDPIVHEVKEVDYKTLREKVKVRIKRVKERRSLKMAVPDCSTARNSSSESIKNYNKSEAGTSGDCPKENIKSCNSDDGEKDLGLSDGEQTKLERKTSSKESCLGNPRYGDENV